MVVSAYKMAWKAVAFDIPAVLHWSDFPLPLPLQLWRKTGFLFIQMSDMGSDGINRKYAFMIKSFSVVAWKRKQYFRYTVYLERWCVFWADVDVVSGCWKADGPVSSCLQKEI